MKILQRNSIHRTGKSHDCLIMQVGNMGNGGKVVKFTYIADNATEKCITEIFDGNKWNHIFGIMDLGIEPQNSAYNIWNEAKRKQRADELFAIAQKMIRQIL